MAEFEILKTWTPYLIVGLGWNLGISIIAAVLGTFFGSIFVFMKLSSIVVLQHIGAGIPAVVRGAPTLFLLFYLAIIIPNEVEIFDSGLVLVVPIWLKAALALTASPLAFTAWNLHAAVNYWRGGQQQSALLFIPNWINGFLITFLASSGASLIGVSELVGRTNTVIKATGPENAILLYSYAAVLFLVTAWAVTFLVVRLSSSLVASDRMSG